ncbi:MAG TPA: hypothetical protein VMO00_18630, partial [Methylomirabilota bacterium]|nr:hypothetical protein [Methylomirabilota bacterium]
MRKISLIVAALMLSALPCFAQMTNKITGAITTGGADCSTATNCVTLSLPPGASSSVIQLAGTWTGTVNFEAIPIENVSSAASI